MFLATGCICLIQASKAEQISVRQCAEIFQKMAGEGARLIDKENLTKVIDGESNAAQKWDSKILLSSNS